MKLSKRLRALADMVGSVSVIGDVGTDHAYLPICLYNENKISRAILSDVNEGPLEIAKKNVKDNLIYSDFSFRLGSGLKPYNLGEVDVFVIAGMGGNLIVDILSESDDIARRANFLLLQPMTAQSVLRKYLNDNSYTIVEEMIVREDHRFYEIIKVKDGSQRKLNDFELELGYKMIENSAYFDFLSYKKKMYKNIIKSIDIAGSDADVTKYKDIINIIDNR